MHTQDVWYQEYQQGRRFLLKILPGASLIPSLVAFVRKENIHYATVLSAIGSVRDVHMRGIKAGAKLPITMARISAVMEEGPFELLSLNGNLIPDANNEIDCHLHIMIGKSSCQVMGGHLTNAQVFATCEIVLIDQIMDGVERQHSKAGGTSTLHFDEE